MVDFLFALINFLHYLLQFRSYEVKCVQFGCFHRGLTCSHSNFTWTGLTPSTILGIRKLRDIGLPNGEDCIPMRSLVLTRIVTDRQTDGHICRSIYRAWKASFVALCENLYNSHTFGLFNAFL